MALRLVSLVALVVTLWAPPLAADTESKPKASKRPAQIQWFGTWEQAKAEAKRTNRPILLTAAAPQCHGVPGIW